MAWKQLVSAIFGAPRVIGGKRRGILALYQDITKRAPSEDEIVQSRQMLQSILDSIPQRVFWKDRNSVILGGNRAFAMDAGLQDAAELAGKTDYDLAWKDTAEIYRNDDKLIMDRESPRLNFEEPQSRPNQKPGWLRTNKLPLRDRDGKVIGVVGTYEDVTDRKEAEEEIRLQAAALQAAANGIAIADREGRILWVNPAFMRLTGYPAEDLIGQTMRVLKSGKQNSDFYRAVWHTILSGEVWRGEIVNRRKDGTLYTDDTTIAPVLEASGAVTHFVAIKQDVTERKQAEETLRASEERYRELFENASDIVYTVGLDFRITSLNRVGQQFLGYTEQEARQLDLRDLIVPRHREIVMQGRQRLLAGETSLTAELDATTKEGRTVTLEVKPRLMYKGGKPAGVVTIARDITGRDQAEMELRQAQKLESVGRLAAGIAHEINTPIQFVGDNTRFLQESWEDVKALLGKYRQLLAEAEAGSIGRDLLSQVRAAEKDTDYTYLLEEIPKALSQTLDGVQRVATIVRAMKEFAHPEAKEMAAADLNQALAGTLTVARNELKYVAEVETEFGALPLVVCNVGDLNQVFLNLLVNAAHAIGEKTNGSGERGKIRVRTAAEGDAVLITISDTGCGIPEAIRTRIFDPFFTTKEVGRGTGQGLAIARSVVADRHKGKLSFESEVGKGTTFYIRLPVDPGAVSKESPAL